MYRGPHHIYVDFECQLVIEVRYLEGSGIEGAEEKVLARALHL